MSDYNWAKLISRLAFLAQSYKIPTSPVVVEVDGKVFPASSFDVQTNGAGDIRLVVDTKSTKVLPNAERPGLGKGRPRKIRSNVAQVDEKEIEDSSALD